jgi:OmpR family response regulator RpaB
MVAAAPSPNGKEIILVVDDEASIRRILETRLTMIGYHVVTAADGEEALEAFRQQPADLVVLDVMMPKLDGYGVCQELRKESDVPIVMLTALGDVADRITGLELGADDYVVKPFSPKDLEARNLSSFFGGGALGIIKIRRHSDHRAHKFVTQSAFGQKS